MNGLKKLKENVQAFPRNGNFQGDNLSKDTIILGGGCFWCIEALFKESDGVLKIVSGYSGGYTENPTYQEICTGKTGHSEVCEIEYDKNKVDLESILNFFWRIHDPTTLNRQGNDVGTQYRSIVLYKNEKERNTALKIKLEIEELKIYKEKLVTEIKQLDKFYTAEDYHQNYYYNNTDAPYCLFVIKPKLLKLKKN